MSWWFLILGVSALAVVWVAIALYVRVRNQLKSSRPPSADDESNPNHPN